MSTQRIKGLETEVLVISGGRPLTTVGDVKSFEMTAQLTILSEGYLGESTERKDEIYKGVKFRMEMHLEGQDAISLMRDIIDRARRRAAGLTINIKTTLNFPNGERAVIMIPNVFFGDIPMNFPSREGYGTITLDGEAEDFIPIAA